MPPEAQAIPQLVQAGWQGIVVLFGFVFVRYLWPDWLKEREKGRDHEMTRDKMYLDAIVAAHAACREEREESSKASYKALERLADAHQKAIGEVCDGWSRIEQPPRRPGD